MKQRHHRTTRRTPRRTLGVLVTAAVATGLTAPALAASPAAAADGTGTSSVASKKAAPHTASRTTISVDRSFQRTAPPVATIRTTAHGEPTSARTSIYVSGKRVATVKVSGAAKVRLPKNLSVGRHTVRAVADPVAASVATSTASTSVTAHRYGSRVVEAAVKYAGVKYKRGGTTRSGMDCSGLTQRAYRDAGVARLPRTAAAQGKVGKVVPRAKAKPGDIVQTPGHVGIYVGGGKMIDAPRPGKKVQVRAMYPASWKFIRVSTAAVTI